MKYVSDAHPFRFVQFAQRVFDVDTVGKSDKIIIEEGIAQLETFYKRIGLVTTLSEVGIDRSNFEIMAKKATVNGTLGSIKPLSAKDIQSIYELAL